MGQWLLHSPFHPLYLKLVGPHAAEDLYRRWVERERPLPKVALRRQPLISIVLPVYNPRREWLEAAVQSVLDQTWRCWQLCVCDDASADVWVADYFQALAATEPRIRFVQSPENLGIAGAANLAGTLAEGEYVGFLDQDDTLSPYALEAIVQASQGEPPDLLYSDEDYIDTAGSRVQPIFKPGFSPDLLRCCMYVNHFLVIRRDKITETGWFRKDFDGSQDYDLVLRVTRDPAVLVAHIPRVLYHWRRHSGSTASNVAVKPYAHDAGLRALSEAVRGENSGASASVEAGLLPTTYRVRWPLPAGVKASLVICARTPKLLRNCLRAIGNHTSWANREVIVVHNRSDSSAAAVDQLAAAFGCIRVPYAGALNSSLMSNLGAGSASGEVLVFLRDDMEPVDAGWLRELLAQASRPEIGIAGARIVYRDGAIQHVGVATGIMGGAGQPHRGAFGSAWWPWLGFTRNVSAVTGALAIRKSVFQELGGFDASLPLNFSDIDLCLRARAAGYEVIIEPSALLRTRATDPPTAEERAAIPQAWLAHDDPFYSPHFSRTQEDPVLEMKNPVDLSPRLYRRGGSQWSQSRELR